MSRNQPKLKPPPRPFFSCGIFRNCTHSVISPKTPPSSASSFLLPPPPPPPPPPPATPPPPPSLPIPSSSSSSSSSSSASHSFTQWRFPLQHTQPPPPPPPAAPPPEAPIPIDLAEAYHASELHFAAGNSATALRLLELSLATATSSPATMAPPPAIMKRVISALRETETARAASKVLLAMVLSEGNRRAAVAAGAAAAAVEVVEFAGAAEATVKERTLAALELLCTVEEGAAEVREHAVAPAALAKSVEEMKGRGRECGIGILAAIYAGERAAEAPAAVAQAVVVALQGECSARGRRKGAQLLRAMKERSGMDLVAFVGDDC